jgi:hypothetical protein
MRLVISALFFALMSLSPLVFAAKLYRFNVDGQQILKDHVPPEYAQLGYEVLNGRGYVIKQVDPAPTTEELTAMAAQKAIAEARLERVNLQRENDLALLRIYAQPSDVERARQRKVDEIDGSISLNRRRIIDLSDKLERAQGRAANEERSGFKVPAEMRLEIAQLQTQIREVHASIKERQIEKIESTKAFAAEYFRMQFLQKYPPGTLENEVPEI